MKNNTDEMEFKDSSSNEGLIDMSNLDDEVQNVPMPSMNFVNAIFIWVAEQMENFKKLKESMDEATMVAPVIIEATGKHTSSLIFLHGLGDTGHGWASSMAELKPPHAKVICPTADTMPVTLNGGYPMPSWFDLISLDVNSKEDEEGIKRAAHKVHGFIDQEVAAGISSDRIVIGGFSQGGALALYSALTYPKKLAGVVGLSCWLPLHKTFPGAAANNPNLHTHFLQCHGNCDPIVPYKWGLLTSTLLKSFVQNVTLNTYQGLAHSTSDEEISDMRNFVSKVMPHA